MWMNHFHEYFIFHVVVSLWTIKNFRVIDQQIPIQMEWEQIYQFNDVSNQMNKPIGRYCVACEKKIV